MRTALGRVLSVLERPLIVPLLHLTIALSPLILLMNWLGYLNGTLHIMSVRTRIDRAPTPETPHPPPCLSITHKSTHPPLW